MVRESRQAEEALTELLGRVPGFQEGIQATREARGIERAFLLGERVQAANVGADVAQDLLAGNTVRLGLGGKSPTALTLPRDPDAIEAFRAGMIRPYITRLRQGQKSVDAFVDDLMTGTELRDKMRVALGGEENLQGFLREAEAIKAIGDTGRMMQSLIKWGGFNFLGSSVIAGAALPLLGIGR